MGCGNIPDRIGPYIIYVLLYHTWCHSFHIYLYLLPLVGCIWVTILNWNTISNTCVQHLCAKIREVLICSSNNYKSAHQLRSPIGNFTFEKISICKWIWSPMYSASNQFPRNWCFGKEILLFIHSFIHSFMFILLPGSNKNKVYY